MRVRTDPAVKTHAHTRTHTHAHKHIAQLNSPRRQAGATLPQLSHDRRIKLYITDRKCILLQVIPDSDTYITLRYIRLQAQVIHLERGNFRTTVPSPAAPRGGYVSGSGTAFVYRLVATGMVPA